MKKSYKKHSDMTKLSHFLAVEAIVPAVVAVLVYVIVEQFNLGDRYKILKPLSLFIIMAMVMQLITFVYSKVIYHYLFILIDSINKVANGNYDVTLNEEKCGPLKELYHNFNKMANRLKSVETLRNDFINDFSHEFKTPITSINGFAKLLLETATTEDERVQYLEIIASESERLSNLSKGTLLMSRLNTQTSIEDKKNYSLDEQIRQCIILLSKEWSEKEIDIRAELKPATYKGNSYIMEQVWINLLNNAIKFTPSKGQITVSLEEEGENIIVAVTDTGKGMTREVMERIYNKYYQGDSSHSTKGLGLGLSITKRIVDLCGGSIEAISEVDKGTTFTITLPKN